MLCSSKTPHAKNHEPTSTYATSREQNSNTENRRFSETMHKLWKADSHGFRRMPLLQREAILNKHCHASTAHLDHAANKETDTPAPQHAQLQHENLQKCTASPA